MRLKNAFLGDRGTAPALVSPRSAPPIVSMQRPRRSLALLLTSFLSLASAAFVGGRMVEGGTVVRLEIEDLAERSDLAIEARVTSKCVTPDPWGRIATEYALRVERTFAGSHVAQRTLRIPGGTLPDGSGLVLPGLPTLAVGEEALLFLTPENARGERLLVGLAQGRLRIVREKGGLVRVVTDSAGLELVDAHGRAIPNDTRERMLPYDAVVARIQAGRARRVKGAAK